LNLYSLQATAFKLLLFLATDIKLLRFTVKRH